MSIVHAESFRYDITGTVYGQQRTIGYELTLPDDVPQIRGLLLGFSGQCGDWRGDFEDSGWERATASMGFGILTLNSSNLWTSDQPHCLFGDYTTDEPSELFAQAIAGAAQESGRPELNNAPIGLFGYSQGGLNSLIVAAHEPERVLGYATTRGGTGAFEIPESMKSVPGVLMAGSIDTVIQPIPMQHNFENYRGQDAEIAYLIHWDQGHGWDFSSRHGGYWAELMWFWLAETVRERYPEGVLPSPAPWNPVELIDIPMEAGWLAETPKLSPSLTASPFPEIAPYNEYSGNAEDASWVPNEAVANVYRAFAAIDPTRPNPRAPGQFLSSPIEFTSPPLFITDPPPPEYRVGDTITANIDPHEFDDLHAITKIEFFDGDLLIGVDTEGPVWGVEFVPGEPGLHALVANATDELGNRATTFRVVVVQPGEIVPEPATLTLVIVGVLAIAFKRIERQSRARGQIRFSSF